MAGVIDIKRIDRLECTDWVPLHTAYGYQLVDRAIPYPERNLRVKATFVKSLDEAGNLIELNGYGIRMAEPGASRGNYIYPKDLRVVRH